MHTVIRYPGSKARLADWIIGHFPEHHSYLEPFLGSGAVLFRKPRSSIETVNDLDGEVINLFECIRRDPDRLAWDAHIRSINPESSTDYGVMVVIPKTRAIEDEFENPTPLDGKMDNGSWRSSLNVLAAAGNGRWSNYCFVC